LNRTETIALYLPRARTYGRNLARHYNAFDLVDDCESEAALGLMKGVDHYDSKKAVEISPWGYYCYWIRAGVTQFLHRVQCGPASVPSHILRGKALDKPRTFSQSLFSAYEPADGETPVDSVLHSFGAYTPADETGIEDRDMYARAWEIARAILTPRQLLVLGARYNDARTLKAIGDDLGVDRERIRQIQQDAIERLQLAMARETCR